jgi:hypothetical protein
MELDRRYIPTELQTKYIKFGEKKWFDDMEVFAGNFIEEFKPGSLYSDMTNSPSELPMESLRK